MLWLRWRKWDTSDQTCTHAPWANVRLKVASVLFCSFSCKSMWCCRRKRENHQSIMTFLPFWHKTLIWLRETHARNQTQKKPHFVTSCVGRVLWTFFFVKLQEEIMVSSLLHKCVFPFRLLYKCANSTPAGDCISSVATLNKSFWIWSCCLLLSCTGTKSVIR